MNAQGINKALRHSDSILQSARNITYKLQQAANAGATDEKIDASLAVMRKMIEPEISGLLELLPVDPKDQKPKDARSGYLIEIGFEPGVAEVVVAGITKSGEYQTHRRTLGDDSEVYAFLLHFSHFNFQHGENSADRTLTLSSNPPVDLTPNVPEGSGEVTKPEVPLESPNSDKPAEFKVPSADKLEKLNKTQLAMIVQKLKEQGKAIDVTEEDTKKTIIGKILAFAEPAAPAGA